MILWFLRLFPQFRDLEALVNMQAAGAEERHAEYDSLHEDIANLEGVKIQLIAEKALLEDRLAGAIADKDRQWDAMQNAIDGERYALRTMVNHATQKAGGGTPYQDAHALPPSEVRKIQTSGPVGRRGRILPSELASKETNRFVGEWIGQLNPQPAAEKVA